MWLTTKKWKRSEANQTRGENKFTREKYAHFCNFGLLSFVTVVVRRLSLYTYVIIITFAVIFSLSRSPSRSDFQHINEHFTYLHMHTFYLVGSFGMNTIVLQSREEEKKRIKRFFGEAMCLFVFCYSFVAVRNHRTMCHGLAYWSLWYMETTKWTTATTWIYVQWAGRLSNVYIQYMYACEWVSV